MSEEKIKPLDIICPSIVGLMQQANNPQVEPYCYSGFVVELCDRWFWVTAAHNLQDLERLKKESELGPGRFLYKVDGKVGVTPVGLYSLPWVDWSVEAATLVAESDPATLVCQRADLMDVGTVLLSEYLVCELEGAGVRPLRGEQLWTPKAESEDEPCGLFVVGFPSCLKNGTGLGSTWDLLSVALGPYDGTPDHPQVEGPAVRFRPQWGKGNFNGGADGMSGGPVFYMVSERVHLVGVQSRAKPNDRYPEFVTVACTQGILEDLSSWIESGAWPSK